MKKGISIILSLLTIVSSIFVFDIINVKAYQCDKDVNIAYSGTIVDDVFGNRDCTFSINHIRDNKFSGHFYVQAETFFQKVDKDVTGTISYIKGD